MEEIKIAGAALPAMPWEERPAGCKDVVWRCSANPIIPRDLLPTSNSIFNSAVVPFKDGYAGCSVVMILIVACVCMWDSARMLFIGISTKNR